MSEVTSDQTEISIDATSEDQVSEFLSLHPDFFERHPEVLADLDISHGINASGTGQTVSLIERQVSSLRDENTQLKQQLNHLIENARANDQLFEKANALIISLIAAQNINDLKNLIEDRMTKDFGSACCRLWLIDGALDIPSEQTLATENLERQIKRFLTNNKVFCGLLKDEEKATLFSDAANLVGSAAVIPLQHEHKLIAILAIASADQDYYRDNMSTSMLNYIGEVVAAVLYQLSQDSN